jgi:hypothetical protein
MIKRIQILYVDSNLTTAGQILKYFNPPQYMTTELSQASSESYQFTFIHCRTYEIALRTLAAHNLDPLSKKRGLQPFDTIFFEIKKRVSPDKYSWINFLSDIAQLGVLPDRLNLPFGLLAFGNQASEAIKDQLMIFGVRKFVKKPFELEELKQLLNDYFNTIYGSTRFYLEERKEAQTGITRRLIRYQNHAGSFAGIHLPYLREEKDGSKTTLWLHSGTEAIDSEMIALIHENETLDPDHPLGIQNYEL